MNSVKCFSLLISIFLLAACVPRAAFNGYYAELINAESEEAENKALVGILRLAYDEDLFLMYDIYNETQSRSVDDDELNDNMDDKYSVLINVENFGNAMIWKPKYNQNLLPLILPY